MKKIVLTATLFGTLTLNSCSKLTPSIEGNGTVVQKIIPITEFNHIEVSDNIHITFNYAPEQKMIFEMDENLIENILIESNRKKINIEENSTVDKSETYTIHLYSPTYESIELNDNSSGVFKEPIHSTKTEINLSGNASLEANLKGKELEVDQSGNSNLKLKGSSKRLKLSLSGNTLLNGESFECQDLTFNLSENSSASINVSNELEGETSGKSNLTYFGEPSKSINSSGLSEITKKNN